MWAVCPGQCLPKRRKTAGMYVSRDDLLLWQNPVRCLQGEAQDLSEETAAVTGAVYGLAPPIPQPAAYGRPASAGQDAGAGPSELLCDTDNSESCQRDMHLTRRALFKWLNRRSQRKSYTWDGFLQVLRQVGWPQVRVRVNLNPFAPLNG